MSCVYKLIFFPLLFLLFGLFCSPPHFHFKFTISSFQIFNSLSVRFKFLIHYQFVSNFNSTIYLIVFIRSSPDIRWKRYGKNYFVYQFISILKLINNLSQFFNLSSIYFQFQIHYHYISRLNSISILPPFKFISQ